MLQTLTSRSLFSSRQKLVQGYCYYSLVPQSRHRREVQGVKSSAPLSLHAMKANRPPPLLLSLTLPHLAVKPELQVEVGSLPVAVVSFHEYPLQKAPHRRQNFQKDLMNLVSLFSDER